MNHTPIAFHFDGPHAGPDAREVAGLLARESPTATTRVESRPAPVRAAATRDAGPVATLALILTATKTALDLADRFKLTEKLTRLIVWAKDRRARRKPIPTVIVPPHALTVPLNQATPEQLADANPTPPFACSTWMPATGWTSTTSSSPTCSPSSPARCSASSPPSTCPVSTRSPL